MAELVVTPRYDVVIVSEATLSLASGLVAEGRVRDALVAALKGRFDLQQQQQQQQQINGSPEKPPGDVVDAAALVHAALLQLREDPWLMLSLDEAAVFAGNSGDEAVKRAYRKLALAVHPDKARWARGDSDVFACLHAAYERLATAPGRAAFRDQRAQEVAARQRAQEAGPKAAAAFERAQARERLRQEQEWMAAWRKEVRDTCGRWGEDDAAAAAAAAAAKLVEVRRAELEKSKLEKRCSHDRAWQRKHEDGKREASLKVQRRLNAQAAEARSSMAALEVQTRALGEARALAAAAKEARLGRGPGDPLSTAARDGGLARGSRGKQPQAHVFVMRGGKTVTTTTTTTTTAGGGSGSGGGSAIAKGRRSHHRKMPVAGERAACDPAGEGAPFEEGPGPRSQGKPRRQRVAAAGEGSAASPPSPLLVRGEWRERPPVVFGCGGPMGFTLVDTGSALLSAAVLRLEFEAGGGSGEEGGKEGSGGGAGLGGCGAAARGVEVGDRLSSVNGADMARLDFASACAALGQAPFPRTLTFRRRSGRPSSAVAVPASTSVAASATPRQKRFVLPRPTADSDLKDYGVLAPKNERGNNHLQPELPASPHASLHMPRLPMIHPPASPHAR
jgi:hypothetical protein